MQPLPMATARNKHDLASSQQLIKIIHHFLSPRDIHQMKIQSAREISG